MYLGRKINRSYDNHHITLQHSGVKKTIVEESDEDSDMEEEPQTNQLNNVNLISGNAYNYSVLEAQKILQANQITKEKHILILYSCGIMGMIHAEKNQFKLDDNFLFNYLKNHSNFCDKEYTEEHDLDKKGVLATPMTVYNKRIFYEVKHLDNISDSNNMNMETWLKLGQFIKKNYEIFDAFVVIHGADTMTYTASMLSFMLENLNKPVIFTGCQIPLVEMRNDAQKNLIDAITVAGIYHIPEVAIMFASKLFRGNRTIKSDNVDLSAYESPNFTHLIHIGTNLDVQWNMILKSPTVPFNLFENINNNISIVKFFPIIDDETFASFFLPPIEGVIIETYGSGNMPLNRPNLIKIMKDATDRGVVILNISQCRKGVVSTSYETGSILEKIGVVFGGDMTVECAMAKLSYVLGKVNNNSYFLEI
jgi:L-asparaginase type I